VQGITGRRQRSAPDPISLHPAGRRNSLIVAVR